MRTKTNGIFAITLFATFLLTGLASGVQTVDDKWWSAFHHDWYRTGLSAEAPPFDMSASPDLAVNIGLVFTFPRTDAVPIRVTDSLIDNQGPWLHNAGFATTGFWFDPPAQAQNSLKPPTDYYGGSIAKGYAWSPVVNWSSATAANTATARWIIGDWFNASLSSPTVGRPGWFQIEVWVPSSGGGRTNTTAAVYTIYDDLGNKLRSFKFSQNIGGTWVPLSTDAVWLGPNYKIEVTNVISDGDWNALTQDDRDNQRVIVVADAIRMISSTGMEIYSSPVAGKLPIAGHALPETVAWIGDNENAIAAFGGSDAIKATLDPNVLRTGAMYCVRSDNSTTISWTAGSAANSVGSALWRYPRGGAYDDKKPIDRDPLEGPIGRLGAIGGIFSTPTLVDANGTLSLVVGGMDGQVYCLTASDGSLRWKGPGVTISESGTPTGWLSSYDDKNASDVGRYDAFGGKFMYATVTNTSSAYDEGSSMVYDFGTSTGTAATSATSDPNRDSAKTNDGAMYGVYAWMPAKLPSDPGRTRDALYGISYYNVATNRTDIDWVRVDQRDADDRSGVLTYFDPANPGKGHYPFTALPTDPNTGKWVRVGTSYWNPSKVVLTTTTQQAGDDLEYAAGATRVVVADAIMIVPDDIGSFSYSSPVWDKQAVTGQVYIGNNNGRVYALAVNPTVDYASSKATNLVWTMPHVQTYNPARNPNIYPNDIATQAWGQILASPALTPAQQQKDMRVVVPSQDGHVYCIGNITNTISDPTPVQLVWNYDSAETTGSDGRISGSGASEPFSSSPAINFDNMTAYIASSGGRLHALNLGPQSSGFSQRKWTYPDKSAMAVPLESFVFSTPTIVNLSAGEQSAAERAANDGLRIYVGSTGGKIYAFKDQGTRARMVSTSTDFSAFEFANPSVDGPIQGSLAMDGGDGATSNVNGLMYFGTMGSGGLGDDGGFYWLKRSTGFASSNGVNLWQYNGYTGLGTVFSSPAIYDQYAYVGISKGRLCAFSQTAFGGQWIGGGQAEVGNPPIDRKRTISAANEYYPQMDLFTKQVYRDTSNAFTNYYATATDSNGVTTIGTFANIPTSSDANFFARGGFTGTPPWDGHKYAFDWPASLNEPSPRQMYLEWGEDMYAIAWNLPELSKIGGGGTSTNGVGDGSKKAAIMFHLVDQSAGGGGSVMRKNPDALYEYSYVADTGTAKGMTVTRTAALCKIPMMLDGGRLPAPGPGWDLSVAINMGGSELPHVPVPLLKGSPGSWTLVNDPSKWEEGVTPLAAMQITHQNIGFNCPLAIIDDGWQPSLLGPKKTTAVGLGWPNLSSTPAKGYDPNRNNGSDMSMHFNGNDWYDLSGTTTPTNLTWNNTFPSIYLGFAGHGTNSRQGNLGIADRSATGLRIISDITDASNNRIITRDSIKSLRFITADLGWHGGNDAVFNPMPWDYPPYLKYGTGTSSSLLNPTRLQRDYPDISRRYSVFQKEPDNTDPTVEQSPLTPCVANPPDPINKPDEVDYVAGQCYLQADAVGSIVDVPKFQPANGNYTKSSSEAGYSTNVTAYIDTPPFNGRLDDMLGDGNDIPNAKREPYRRYNLSLDVPPDYHMVLEKPTSIDITGEDRAPAPHGLGVGVANTSLAGWYKQFTVRNVGNVNLPNLKIAKQVSYDNGQSVWDLNLFSDNVNPMFPIWGSFVTTPLGTPTTKLQTGIVGSLDGWDPNFGDLTNSASSYRTPVTDGGGNSLFGGAPVFTLSKARVGDLDGTVLMIPDQRKVVELQLPITPILPSISVRVPLSQPSGSYKQQVPIYADLFGNKGLGDDVMELSSDPTGSYVAEPRTEPSVVLNVSVAEARMTGGATPGSALQTPGYISDTGTSGSVAPPPAWGNTHPAAWRDPVTGNINVFWSTNMFAFPDEAAAKSSIKRADTAWYLAHGWIPYDQADDIKDNGDPSRHRENMYNWKFGNQFDLNNPVWMNTPISGAHDFPFPRFSYPENTAGAQPNWPDSVPDKSIDVSAKSVKYTSPYAAMVENTPNKVWLFWQGQIDVLDSVTNKIERKSRLFYSDVTGGDVLDPNDRSRYKNPVLHLDNDDASPKMAPKASVYDILNSSGTPEFENMLLTWFGGDEGKWNIFAKFNHVTLASGLDEKLWSKDMRLSTPTCLVSATEPAPAHRLLQLKDGNGAAYAADNYFDIAYAGTTKYDQSSDILLTRYSLDAGNPTNPKMNVVRLPRIMKEELLRDPKRNVYTSAHLSWDRPTNTAVMDAWDDDTKTVPFIHVLLPKSAIATATSEREISATDGTTFFKSLVEQAGAPINPTVDKAAGVYTYSYPPNSTADKVLGQMLVDYSAGIIRFTKQLPEMTKVIADYTPKAVRLTRGAEADSAPFMFIEKRPMNCGTWLDASNATHYIGVIPGSDASGNVNLNNVGRLWLFWRKPSSSSVKSSAVYYKTFRIGATPLVFDANKPPSQWATAVIPMDKTGEPLYDAYDATGSKRLTYPLEISWDGKTVFFPSDRERYAGMPDDPGMLYVTFKAKSNQSNLPDIPVVFDVMSWIEELPETAVPARQRVNEGQISAFVDPLITPSKVWLFWSSTRAGTSDIYYQTISPYFRRVLNTGP